MAELKAPKVTVLPIEQGATPDLQNVNKHTQRGAGLLENSLRKRGAFRSIASAGKGVKIPVVMAGNLTLQKAIDAGFTEVVNVHVSGNQIVNVVRDDVAPGSAEAIALGLEDNEIGKQSYNPDLDILAAVMADPAMQALKNEDKIIAGLLESMGLPKEYDEPSEPRKTLAERFGVPPFSVLDARQGYWQDRKRAWIALGLKGELGRSANAFASQSSLSLLMKSKVKINTSAAQMLAFARKHNIKNKIVKADACDVSGGTSIFDPVLSEILYRWFVPKGGHILNPMSGEATHGIVAGHLGYKFTGVELRPEQSESNRAQAAEIGVNPVWITADALTIDTLNIAPADFVVSCPPYADLEVYSDNPLDISTMDYQNFIETYSQIINKSCALLVDNRFAAFVVGEVRDKKGIYYDFVGDTIKAFKNAGMQYYNEMILVTSVGSLPIRAGRQFDAGRKIGKTHQNVLVFLKGDIKRAVKDCGTIEMEFFDGFGFD